MNYKSILKHFNLSPRDRKSVKKVKLRKEKNDKKKKDAYTYEHATRG